MDTSDNPQEKEETMPAQGSPSGAAARDAPASPTRFARLGKVVAPVAAALLIGGGVVYAIDDHSGSSASAGNTAVAVGTPAGSGGLGGVAGEQHILGTVAAKTSSSVSVKSSSGTATYTVNATTEIVRNGQAATLGVVQVGDPVLVHVYPSSSGQMLVERLLAGSSASDSGPGGFAPPSSSGMSSS